MSTKYFPDLTVTIDEAVELTSKSRSTIKRALLSDTFPNAFQVDDRNATWHIPLSDLVDARFIKPELAAKYQREQATQLQQQPTSELLEPNLEPSQHYLPIATSKLLELGAKPLTANSDSQGANLQELLLQQIAITEMLLKQVKALVPSD